MTFVPDNAALCDCWIKASDAERAAAPPKISFGQRGLRSCERCHGAGFWLSESSAIEAHPVQVTDEMVERAITAYWASYYSWKAGSFRTDMRAALEAALNPFPSSHEVPR